MKIERKYYTELKKQMEELEDGLRKIREAMTETEKQMEKEENESKFQKLLERIVTERERTRQVVDRRKKVSFLNMVRAGLALAKAIEADFEADSGEEWGKICLTTDLMLFDMSAGQNGRDELILLMCNADNIMIASKGNLMEWKFSFQFCDIFFRES